MSIKADYHMHSHFSADANTPMEDMIRRAIALEFTHICFTEHMDFDFPVTYATPDGICYVDMQSYHKELLEYKEKYADKIQINFGIELGVQPHLTEINTNFAKAYDFDFVIASSHVVKGLNPAYSQEIKDMEEEVLYRDYFAEEIYCMKEFREYDVYGHIDYVIRYGKAQDRNYSFQKYEDLFEEMADTLISTGKGIEINTSGIRKGLKEMHPTVDFLRRYRQKGGEIITVGSDAHIPRDVGADFDKAAAVLKECGFKYYCTFEKRVPLFHKI